MSVRKNSLRSSKNKIKNLYIHIPYCRSKCLYCDFYSENIKNKKETLNEYFECLGVEFEKYRKYLSQEIDTIYIGGGTPSVIPQNLITNLLCFISNNIQMSMNYEYTFEMNPESVTRELLIQLLKNRVNRISLGVQCLNDKMLKNLGRVHNREDVINALTEIFLTGFKNVGVDFLIGIPVDTEEFIEHIGLLLKRFPITHISAYILTLKEGEEKTKRLSRIICDEETAIDQYIKVDKLLREKKFIHYEISNYSLYGYQSKHNINYWECGEYIGIGASAAGHFINDEGERLRYKNVADITTYIKSIKSGEMKYEEIEKIDTGTHINEIIMLGLRKQNGIDLRLLENLLIKDNIEKIREKISILKNEGLIKVVGTRLCPTAKGFIFNNRVATTLMF